MKKIIVIILIIIVLVLAGYFLIKNSKNQIKEQPNVEIKKDDDSIISDTEGDIVNNDEAVYRYTGKLVDVTNRGIIRGLVTSGNASGGVSADYINGQYLLVAKFKDLPDPKNNEFYEGWIVRRNPLEVISTGVAEKIDSSYVNNYSSDRDLTSHDFYVLTIEPDDGNSAPADHILEGILQLR